MLPARLERLEFDARRTAREINDRRELLDWFLNARRELEDHKAAQAASNEAEARLASTATEVASTPKGAGMLRSSSASRLGAEVVAPSPLRLTKSSAVSTPALRRTTTPSFFTMAPANAKNTMHSRADELMAAAQRNARQLEERRTTLNEFKDLKIALAQAKAKKGGVSMSDPLPPGTTLMTTGCVQRLSYNSRCNFAQKYSLQPLATAVQEVPPPHPVHPTSSMRNRLEACEHRVMWNHQTMSHNQMFLDDFKRFAKGEV